MLPATIEERNAASQLWTFASIEALGNGIYKCSQLSGALGPIQVYILSSRTKLRLATIFVSGYEGFQMRRGHDLRAQPSLATLSCLGYFVGSLLYCNQTRRLPRSQGYTSIKQTLSTAPNPAATPPSSLSRPFVRRSHPASSLCKISATFRPLLLLHRQAP